MIVQFYKCRPKIKFPFVAWMIMLVEGMMPWKKDSYSHLAMGFHISTKRSLDATGKGVRNRSMSNFLKQYEIIEAREMDVLITPSSFINWIESVEEISYDHAGIFELLIEKLFRTKDLNIGHGYKMMSCQEIPLLFLDTFAGANIKNPDDYGLLSSWDVVSSYTRVVL